MTNEIQPWSAVVAIPFVLLLSILIATITQKNDEDGRPTYEYAGFKYPQHAKFDNTWLTWSTDYLISLTLYVISLYIYRLKSAHERLKKLILILLALYGGSTLLGGMAHHMYSGDTDQLNGTAFYVMWVAVLGCTVFAGGVQGLIGDELLVLHGFKRTFSCNTWAVWCFTLLFIIAFGGFSCARPASDIFLVGVTQSIPVFYLQYCLYKTCYCCQTIPHVTFWVLFVGAIFNAPLIVLYPHMLEKFGASITNAALHTNLLVSWGCQGVGFYSTLAKWTASGEGPLQKKSM